MLIETAWCWAQDRHPILTMTDCRGLEFVVEQQRAGRGVLMVTPHMTCLEIGARAVSQNVPGVGVYRPLGNPVMEWYQNRGRRHYALGMFGKHDMRSVIRFLRQGGVLWYAPDQDFGPAESLFAPFFGVTTATLLATHRLPKMTGCAVVVMVPRWESGSGRYVVEISPPLDDFPSADAQADLTRVNAMLEAGVRKALEQYWWIHRRFKTRPPGAPDFYAPRERREPGSDTDARR